MREATAELRARGGLTFEGGAGSFISFLSFRVIHLIPSIHFIPFIHLCVVRRGTGVPLLEQNLEGGRELRVVGRSLAVLIDERRAIVEHAIRQWDLVLVTCTL